MFFQGIPAVPLYLIFFSAFRVLTSLFAWGKYITSSLGSGAGRWWWWGVSVFHLLQGLKCHVICWVLQDSAGGLFVLWCSQVITGHQHCCHSYLLINDVIEICTKRYALCVTALLVLLPIKGVPRPGQNPTKPTLLLSFLPAVRSGCFAHSLNFIEEWISVPLTQNRMSTSDLFLFRLTGLCLAPRTRLFPFLETVFLCSHQYILVDTL